MCLRVSTDPRRIDSKTPGIVLSQEIDVKQQKLKTSMFRELRSNLRKAIEKLRSQDIHKCSKNIRTHVPETRRLTIQDREDLCSEYVKTHILKRVKTPQAKNQFPPCPRETNFGPYYKFMQTLRYSLS